LVKNGALEHIFILHRLVISTYNDAQVQPDRRSIARQSWYTDRGDATAVISNKSVGSSWPDKEGNLWNQPYMNE
jgi:hypothetical protein